VKAAIRYLRAQGYDPKDTGTQKVGHDIRLGKRRIEVKASEKNRAWMEVDIRSACNVTVNRQQNRAVAERNGLNIDGIVEVTRMGKPGGPVVYFYPRSLVEKYGLLGASYVPSSVIVAPVAVLSGLGGSLFYLPVPFSE